MKNSDSPSSMSPVDGDTQQSEKTPYLTTDIKEEERQEIIDQPQLTNPGSMDNNRSSTILNIVESIRNYLSLTNKAWNSVALYILGIAVYGGSKLGPAIFREDLHVREFDQRDEIKCYTSFTDFIEIFANRKALFNADKYMDCVGFYHQVVDREKLTEDGYIPWPFTKVSICKTPKIIDVKI